MQALKSVNRHAAKALNLEPYHKAEWEAWHAPGSRIVTASGVPALLGVSRWTSRWTYLKKVRGDVSETTPATPAMIRGRMLESIAAELVAMQRHDLVVMAGNYVAFHPRIPRFLATPDVVVAKRTERRRELRYGVGEIKTVGRRTFESQWADGPPMSVEWQHHAQMAATGARWGIIAALLIAEHAPSGDLPFELVLYERERDDNVVAEVEATVVEALQAIDTGELGPPDPSPHTTRLLRATYKIEEDRIAHLQENEDAARMFDAWQAANVAMSEARQTIEAAKDYFTALAPEASLFLLPQGRSIRVKASTVKSYTVAEHTMLRWTLKREA